MAYQEQFTCDVCGTVRQPSNNWFLSKFDNSSEILGPRLVIEPFATDTAKMVDLNFKYLCGQSCVSKWVSQNLESLHSKPAAPQVTLVVEECNDFNRSYDVVENSGDRSNDD